MVLKKKYKTEVIRSVNRETDNTMELKKKYQRGNQKRKSRDR